MKTEVFRKAGWSTRCPGDAACCLSKTVQASDLVGPEFMSKASVTNQVTLATCFCYLTLSFILCTLGLAAPTVPDCCKR